MARRIREGVMRARRGRPRHDERHLGGRAGWLRAAVLGANDGIVSISSLLLGVAAAGASRSAILTAGVAGLLAGALSMAAGEYVSVSSQRDVERADLALEARELAADPAGELEELTSIYESRGLDSRLAREVAVVLSARDALGVHARDELGLDPSALARPWQAAWASSASFTVGASPPLVAAAALPQVARVPVIVGLTLVTLGALGYVGARLGGARTGRGVGRVTVWGAVAMALTAGIGALFGRAVS